MGNGIRNYYFGVLETDRVRSVDERVVSERFLYAQQSNLNLTETDCGKALFIHEAISHLVQVSRILTSAHRSRKS